jgi:hypothetical protein
MVTLPDAAAIRRMQPAARAEAHAVPASVAAQPERRQMQVRCSRNKAPLVLRQA